MQINSVKICGITKKEQAIAIAHMGVGALGFIFYPASPRFIAPQAVHNIAQSLPPFVQKIGVFVDCPISDLLAIYKTAGLTGVQLHGTEPPEYGQQLSDQNIFWYKAFRIDQNFDFSKLTAYHCQHVLLDSYTHNIPGGTGKSFNWQQTPWRSIHKKIILSGGLNADNLETALKYSNPVAIDVSSSLEDAPGEKNVPKTRAFLAKLAQMQQPAIGR